MTRSKVTQVVFCAVLGLLIGRGPLLADEKQPAVEVLNPKADSEVDEVEFVEGRIAKRDGKHPVIVVKALNISGQPWWCQAQVKDVDEDGTFVAEAIFGRPQDSGVDYAVLIFLAKDQITAKSYKRGQQLFTLPEARQSKIVKVRRK